MFVNIPPIYEQSDFSGGWNPDQEFSDAEVTTLRDVLNLLPPLVGTGALETRKGFRRFLGPLAGGLSDYRVVSMHPFRANGTIYMIVVLGKDVAAANNVRIYAVDLEAQTAQRIDTPGVTWNNPTDPHWGMGIDDIYYGGSNGNTMYSWDPATDTWEADASVNPNWKTWTTKTFADSVASTEYARDYAFTGKEIVKYGAKYYRPAEGIRFGKWESGQRYSKGERVSRKATWSGGSSYYISWECIKAHTAGSDNDQPGTGSNWQTYWKKVRLAAPVGDDNETTPDWFFVPIASKTSVAVWHASRLWMRYHRGGDKSRLLFSAPLKPDKGMDIADLIWDPTDFAPGNDMSGPGGGWIDFNDGTHGGVIEALLSYGQYLLVFKRQAVWTLSGNSEETFTVRRLARGVGAVGQRCVVELDGLVYFLSDDGLYVTDGTAVQPVPGFEKFARSIEARIDQMAADDAPQPTMAVYQDRIWISLPDPAASDPHWTLVYEPRTGAIFKTDIPATVLRTARIEGVPKLFFAPASSYGSVRDLLFQYDKSNANDKDDTGAATYGSTDIAWHMKTAWFPFGTVRAERRVRRIWFVVQGALTYTLRAFRNWVDTAVKTTTRAVTATSPVHIEGEWFADSHAVSFKLSASAAPAKVLGFALHSEPRRVRYHT
jgi:hypothetical protein